MANSKDAVIYYEAATTPITAQVLVDSGDRTVFNSSTDDVWSIRSGYAPELLPDGVKTGHNMLSVSATNDTVNVAAHTVQIAGVSAAVTATSDTITRGVTTGYIINSFQVDNAGAVTVVTGTEGSAFSETRGAAGGPPFIVVGSVEIGQTRTAGTAAAPLTASEIFQTPGVHVERADFPCAEIDTIGEGTRANAPASKVNAYVEFSEALPQSHTASATKAVYLSLGSISYSKACRTVDFVPARISGSGGSTEIYGAVIPNQSKSLGGSTFTAMLNDGMTDELETLTEENLTFKFLQNKNRSPFSITQGLMTSAVTYPVADEVQAAVAITPFKRTVSFAE